MTIFLISLLAFLVSLYVLTCVGLKFKTGWFLVRIVARLNGIRVVKSDGEIAYYSSATSTLVEKEDVEAAVESFLLKLRSSLPVPIVMVVCLSLNIIKSFISSLVF